MILMLFLTFLSPKPFIMEALEDSILSLRSANFSQMNYSPVDSETTFVNLRVNSDTTNIQNEEQLLLNPLNSSNLVAVWRDFRLGYRRVGVGYSMDRGNTWHDALFTGSPYTKDSDPTLTVDMSGNFYAAVLSFEDIWDSNAIVVFRSSDGGITWDGPWMAVGPSYEYFEDKELIACDRTGGLYSGNLYISWTRFNDAEIMLVRSTDHGMTWSSPVSVSDVPGAQWSFPVVDAGGSVHVFWVDYNTNSILQDISSDGGVTFGEDLVVAPIETPSRILNGNIMTFSYPAVAVDLYPESPHYGSIYMAYMDTGPGGDADIFLIKSVDGGFTWSSPLRVNDDPIGNGADQFHPWIAVDETGAVSVIFYDRRLDPQNLLFDLFLAQSMDGGESFLQNLRVSTVSSNPQEAGVRSGLIGEYIALDSYKGIPLPMWTDTREGSQDVYFGLYNAYGIGERRVTARKGGLSVVTMLKGSQLILSLESQMTLSLELFNMLGQRVFWLPTTNFSLGSDYVNLPPLRNGIYFLKIQGDLSANYKIVKIR